MESEPYRLQGKKNSTLPKINVKSPSLTHPGRSIAMVDNNIKYINYKKRKDNIKMSDSFFLSVQEEKHGSHQSACQIGVETEEKKFRALPLYRSLPNFRTGSLIVR